MIATVIHTFPSGVANRDLLIDTKRFPVLFRLRVTGGRIPLIRSVQWFCLDADRHFFCTIDPRKSARDTPDPSFDDAAPSFHPASFVLQASSENAIQTLLINERARNQIIIRNGISILGTTLVLMFEYDLVPGELDWLSEIVKLMPNFKLIGKRQMSPGKEYFQTTDPRRIVPRGGQEGA